MPDFKDEAAERALLQREYREEVNRILGYLKDEDEKIFRLIYLEGLSMDEVAVKMNMTKTAIYGRVSRGRKQLRRMVKESGV